VQERYQNISVRAGVRRGKLDLDFFSKTVGRTLPFIKTLLEILPLKQSLKLSAFKLWNVLDGMLIKKSLSWQVNVEK
jgi:hypothetical protein